MKIIIGKQVFRGPAQTTSLTLRDRLLSYLRFLLTRSGSPPAEASMVVSAFSEELVPLFHGKFRSKDWLLKYVQHQLLQLGLDQRKASASVADLAGQLDLNRPLEEILPSVGKWTQKLATEGKIKEDQVAGFVSNLSKNLGRDLRDLTDEERTSVAKRAMSILRRLPSRPPEKELSKIESFVGIIDDYAKAETQEAGAKGKRIRHGITMMMVLSDLVENSDDVSVRLVAIDPREMVKTEKGDKPIGQGWYQVVAKIEKDGGSKEEDTKLDLFLRKQDPKEVEKGLNDSIRKMKASKSGRAEGKGEWIRAVREDPVKPLAPKKFQEPKYSRNFFEAHNAVMESIEKIGELRENILNLISKFPAADFSLPGNTLLDVVNELSQSGRALSQASLGRETIDLGQFEARAALRLPAEMKHIHQGLLGAKNVLVGLLAKLDEASSIESLPAGPTALAPDEDVSGEREKRLLDWEISLAKGIANRGIRSIDEVLGDETFWHQFSLKA